MKKLITFLILTGIVLGCKKGENDPPFSLLTRSSRLTGTWSLQEATIIKEDTTTTYDNNALITSYEGFTSDELPSSIVFTFEANGNYSIEKEYQYPDDYNGNGGIAFVWNYLERGVWNFAGGDENAPSKSKLLLLPEYFEESTSVGGANIDAFEIESPNEGYLFDIDELRNQRLVLKFKTIKNFETGSKTEDVTLIFNKN